jgi:beta-lactamase class A
MNRLNVRQSLLFMIVAILAAGAGWYAHTWYIVRYEHHAQRRVALKGYEFTSPLLDIELLEGFNIDYEPIPFKYKIDSFIKKKLDSGQVRNVAVYYRDLHDGPWFGINENTEFNPASMMKVPVMVAWLKRAEKDRLVLKRRMKYEVSQDPVPQQYTKPARAVIPGQSYTVDELLHYMMNYSDNKATSLLFKALSDAELADVLDSMDVNNNPHDDHNSTTIHGFSGFFRILYNASYLNREMSEKALQLLSLQDFPQGIAAGVPKGIAVAAKFGEIVPDDHSEDVQLHEFGIVYHPRSPYILGIMTQGGAFAQQAGIIRDISQMIYSEVDSSIRH